MKHLKFLSIFLIAATTACTKPLQILDPQDGPPPAPFDINQIADPTPRNEPKSLRGNPESYVVLGRRYYVLPESKGFIQRGFASWYGTKFHGKQTSNGETYDMYAMTAAHKTLPLPTYLRVTNLRNDRNIVVRVNDRGPFLHNRIIDLSYAAAVKLGIHNKGTGFVEIAVITMEAEHRPPATFQQQNSKRSVYLQVGAFAEKENAVKLQNSVSLPHLPATRIAIGSHQQKPVFRVQMGPISSIHEADKITEHLNGLGITSSRVVVENAIATEHVVQ